MFGSKFHLSLLFLIESIEPKYTVKDRKVCWQYFKGKQSFAGAESHNHNDDKLSDDE